MTTSLPNGADAITALLRHEVKPVLFLGAGASVKSGIPLAAMLVDVIARFAYCKLHDRDPDDPTLMRSDWIRWLEQQKWYRSDESAANFYPAAVENLLQPRSRRKEFFRRVLKPNVPASEGYRKLAHLLALGAVRTVLTTNFDDLVVRAVRETPAVRHIAEIATESDRTLFSTNPSYPQIVYLHGSVDHYTDRNLITETRELDQGLGDLLQPLLRDHPLIVIGYRGAEPSIMKHLLLNNAGSCGRFREGIFWCHLPESTPTRESPLLYELEATIGSNLQFVEIAGFDELMISVERSIQASSPKTWGAESSVAEAAAPTEVNDLQATPLTLEDLNESLLRTKLAEYAAAMRLSSPSLSTSEQIWEAMLARNLALTTSEGRRATKGGQLLFAKRGDLQIESAKIVVTVSGTSSWVDEILDQSSTNVTTEDVFDESIVLSGDIWSQLDQASNLLSRVNRPFRMKGPVSQEAFPYPPLALKELLTNLLAHRDYQVDSLASITIKREDIRFENPGGLVDSVRRQLDDESIQEVIGEGRRRLKGYRNPVVADFFFSAGAMDKEGSGLPDVIQEAANNLNTVEFGPTSDNAAFVAVIQCRPEALLVNRGTKTAHSPQRELRYSPNLLSVASWPDQVHKLGTIASPKDISRIQAAQPSPFGAHRGWIWTFANIDDEKTRPLIELSLAEERHVVPTAELLTDRDASLILPRLLNMALESYLSRLGMLCRNEANRLRAYYPADDDGPREISYKSMFRQSKRIITKPIISRTNGNIVYWEHKAVSLRFERFGTSWALAMLPGYVFTLDGHSQSIASERIGPLSTRRASRDYNPTVLRDLVFWARMLSAENEAEFDIPLSSGLGVPVVRLAAMIPTFVFQGPIESGLSEATESEMLEDAELDMLQNEIEQAIADSANDTEESSEITDK